MSKKEDLERVTKEAQKHLDPIELLIEDRIRVASTKTKSDDEVVQIAWIVDGLDLWYRTDGKRGHSPADTRRYVISRLTRLLENES